MTKIPKALTLYSDNGDHAGFMLIAPKEGDESGDCVFMLTPVSVEGIDSNLGIVVSELKVAGEHKFSCLQTNQGYELTVHPKGLPVVTLLLNTEFSGEIYTEFDGTNKCIGTAKPAKKKNA
ncbi:MAG: hypothetical protein AB7S75_05485 [Desulfococcaceae bacterium]